MLAADIDITVADVIVYVVAGLVIGALARLLLPGRQDMSIVATIILGVIAAVIGGMAWEAIFPDNDGVAWIGSIVVAVILLYLYVMLSGRGRTRSTP
ncbi:MAG: GlsB/YeaQ/YmgE family stress response membrane protein [Actinomycetota bacterium]